jgi:hypothetical protein
VLDGLGVRLRLRRERVGRRLWVTIMNICGVSYTRHCQILLLRLFLFDR